MQRFLAPVLLTFGLLAGAVLVAAWASAGVNGDVYWSVSPHGGSADHGRIAHAALDGSGVSGPFISGTTGGAGVALDSRYVYRSNYEVNGTIGRANRDGSGVTQHFITGAEFPVGMAVDSRHIYWTTYDHIGRANLDGSHVNERFITVEGAVGLAVDGRYVY